MKLAMIKRYKTGKLYSISNSAYVSVIQLKKMVAAGFEILIIDNKTKRDVTREVLNGEE